MNIQQGRKSKFEQTFDEWIKEKYPNCEILQNGFPDRLIVTGGVTFFVEIKSPNELLTASQADNFRALNLIKKDCLFIARKSKNGFDLNTLQKDKLPTSQKNENLFNLTDFEKSIIRKYNRLRRENQRLEKKRKKDILLSAMQPITGEKA